MKGRLEFEGVCVFVPDVKLFIDAANKYFFDLYTELLETPKFINGSIYILCTLMQIKYYAVYQLTTYLEVANH